MFHLKFNLQANSCEVIQICSLFFPICVPNPSSARGMCCRGWNSPAVDLGGSPRWERPQPGMAVSGFLPSVDPVVLMFQYGMSFSKSVCEAEI